MQPPKDFTTKRLSLFWTIQLLGFLLAGSGLAAGCGDSAGPDDPSDASALGVITRNLYVGTDVDAVILALRTEDPADDFAALGEAIEILQRTDFPARAAAIADEIAGARPHAVGLQEVSKIDVSLPLSGVDIHQEFLPTLLGELTERGLQYVPAAQIKNIESSPFPGISLVDYDVLLVDQTRVTVDATSAQNFSENLGQVAAGVSLVRGWVTARVTIDGIQLTLASTHLESGNFPGIPELRVAQVRELMESLDPEIPAVLMGDLNDSPESPMYRVIADAGFVDVWSSLQPGVAGSTCCYPEDLSNTGPGLQHRIDFIFARGLEQPSNGLIGAVELLGEEPGDRIPEVGIWPSDHAGIAADLSLPTSLAGR